MNVGLRARLSLMMFLQYFIWGAWAVMIYPYLTRILGFDDHQAGWIFSILWLACIVSPFIGGQIADRWFPTQWFLALCHGIGAAALLLSAQQRDFSGMLLYMSIYSLAYAPTLALTNSLAFHHLKKADQEFGAIRVWGTIGWIVAGLAISGWRYLNPAIAEQGDMLLLAGYASIALAAFCLLLPHTPPKGEAENPFAFVKAFSLLKDRNFFVFMLIAFIVTTELQFYYLPTAAFLEDLGRDQNIIGTFTVTDQNVAGIMGIMAQGAEIIAMAFVLTLLLPKIGIRKALVIGVLAWPLRYLIFAFGEPFGLLPLVVFSLTLHGIGYTFFFVVSQIYVNRVAPPDIRASAQAMLTLFTLGVGNFLGTMFTKWILDYWAITDETGRIIGHHWTPIFLVPCVLTLLCAVAFLAFFRDPRAEAPVPKEAIT